MNQADGGAAHRDSATNGALINNSVSGQLDSAAPPKNQSVGRQSNGEAVLELTRRADLLATRGKYKEALSLVDEVLCLEPMRADLHHGRGQCLVHLGKAGDAVACFEEALRLEPGHQAAIRAKATALANQQRWAESVICLKEALQSDPANAEMRVELARCLTEYGVQLKSSGASAQLFHDALQASENYAVAHFQLGVIDSEADRPAEAKKHYARAVELNPGYIEAWNNLGVACRNLGEPDHALEAYSMALKTNMNCKKTRENMAICLLELGCRSLQQKDMKQASSFLKKALTFNAHNADIYFNWCYVCRKAKVGTGQG